MPATPTYSAYGLTAPSSIANDPRLAPDRKMHTALKFGMEGLDASINIEPTCTTGNCTWSNTVATLAVCSECFDTTDQLASVCLPADNVTGSDAYCNYTLPNGLLLNGNMNEGTFSKTMFTTSGEFTNTSVFQHIKQPVGILSTAGFMHSTTHDFGDAFSNQCALYWCVQKFNVSISQGNMTSTLLDTFTANGTDFTPDTGDLDIEVPAAFMQGTGHSGSGFFKATQNVTSAFSNYFYTSSQFTGSIYVDPLLHTSGQTTFLSYILPMSTPELSVAFGYLAGNMTNAIRMSNPVLANTASTGAAGKILQNVAKVNVVWWWLFLPVAMLLLSLAFLIATIATSRKQGVMLWKTSPLASFYHPLTQEGREKLQNAQGLKELEALAEKVQVKGEMTEKGYRLTHGEHHY